MAETGTVRAHSVGRLAVERLRDEAFRASVLAVVSGAVYLREKEGEVVWLSPASAPRHRRAILVRGPLPAWPVGASCLVQDGALCSDRDSVAWRDAPVWDPPAPPARPRGLDAASRALRQAIAHAAGTPSGCDAAWRSRAGAGDAVFRVRVQGAIRSCLSQARAAWNVGDAASTLASLGEVVGLGQGLTPSGDDAAGGFLFAVRHLDVRSERMADELIDAWLARVGERMHDLGRVLLADLARGHGPEPLHGLVVGLLAGAACGDLAARAERVTQIGRSSGWDLLAGAAAAFGVDVGMDDGEDGPVCASVAVASSVA